MKYELPEPVIAREQYSLSTDEYYTATQVQAAFDAGRLAGLEESAEERDSLRARITALEGQEPVIDKQMLWLWKNGDHYLAFDNLYPCFTQGGDPMTLGEPAVRAIFRTSFCSEYHAAGAAQEPKV